MSDLTEAIKAGDAAKVAALLDADPALLQSAEKDITPILLAIYHGKPDLARLFVDRGARLSFGEACALGDLDSVKSMLAADPALLDSRSADGFPGVGLAIFFRHPEVARYLIEQGADVNAVAENRQRVAPVHAAVAARDYATMRMLLERGADPNARQEVDYTALHNAAAHGDLEMAKLLLAHGADRNARSSDGMNVADVARKYGHPDVAEWLEKGVGDTL
jgi:ankyrin repeat protein